MNFHELHGFHALKPEITIDTDTVMVAEELHLAQVSDYLDIDMSLLEKLNPKYRRKILPGAGGPHDLRLPVDRVNQFIAYQDSIIVHKNDIYLAKNNIDKEPAPRNRRSTPPSPDDVALNYTVKSGDNLGFISSWYGVSVSALKDWNGLYGNVIRSGQKLTVYVNKSKADELRRINDLSFEDKQARIGKPATVVTADATPGPSPADNQFVLYTVKRGDNLWDIARLYPGISNEDIKRLNNMTSNNLKPGQILKIKRREG
jgi:membrane-bound lytic murein transglycosylase D